MKRVIRLLNVLMLLFTTIEVKAQIITDRPDQTESSSTVGNGNLQIESGFLVNHIEQDVNNVRQILAPSTLFRYGINRTIELRVLSQLEIFDSEDLNRSFSGISDLEVGTKIQILKRDDKNTEIAILSHLVLPSGSESLSLGKEASINKLSISHDLGGNLSLGYNVGYNYFSEGNGDLTYSVALNIGVNDFVGVYIEPYGDIVEFETHIAKFDAGFTYLLNDNLQLDFSFGTGIGEKSNYLSAGVSWFIEGSKG